MRAAVRHARWSSSSRAGHRLHRRTFQAIQSHHKARQVGSHEGCNVDGGSGGAHISIGCMRMEGGAGVAWGKRSGARCSGSDAGCGLGGGRRGSPRVSRHLSNRAERAKRLAAISGRKARHTSQAQLIRRHCGEAAGAAAYAAVGSRRRGGQQLIAVHAGAAGSIPRSTGAGATAAAGKAGRQQTGQHLQRVGLASRSCQTATKKKMGQTTRARRRAPPRGTYMYRMSQRL